MKHQKYLENCEELFVYYKSLADKAIASLSIEDLYLTPAPGSNSVYVILKHLSGNMRSRWRDFLTSDGEKNDRNRDDEFTEDSREMEAILSMWEKGWSYLFTALEESKHVESDYIVYIRNEGHTIEQAVQRQLAHYSYHIGQIVFLSKMIQKENFISLSIPKNESDHYNQAKFKQEKVVRFFTERMDINTNQQNT